MTKKYNPEDIKVLKADPRWWDEVDISMMGFAKNLNNAAVAARDFARGYVEENLPDEMRYVVCLGCSYDGNPLSEDEKTFPEDYNEPERKCSSQDEVVKLLWRQGMVPEWINVEVDDVDSRNTVIKLICCGRFSSNKRTMYHPTEGRAPFHVLGPSLPLDYVEGVKFPLCWNKK